jgi:hypothetical protein
VEKNDKIKAGIGHSPDFADRLCLIGPVLNESGSQVDGETAEVDRVIPGRAASTLRCSKGQM